MIYHHIRSLREDSDMTQKQVAAYLNCSQQVYSNYELGQGDIPTEQLIKLAELYQTTTDYLLGLTKHRGRPICYEDDPIQQE